MEHLGIYRERERNRVHRTDGRFQPSLYRRAARQPPASSRWVAWHGHHWWPEPGWKDPFVWNQNQFQIHCEIEVCELTCINIYNITCLVRIEVLSHQRFTQKPHISFLSDQWKWRHVESVWDSLNFGDFPYRWIKQSTSLSSNQTWLAGKSLRWRFLAGKFISPCDFLATFHYLQVPIS